MNFDGAELTIYCKNGEQVSLDLSQMQTFVALKILGFKFENGECAFYSDETLMSLMKYKGNPFNLREVE